MRGGVARAEGTLGIAFIAIGPIDLCNAPAVCRVKSTLLVCILQQVAFPSRKLWMISMWRLPCDVLWRV